MALYENFNLEDFPYKGYFFTYETPTDVPLDQMQQQEVVVFETACDIQKNSRLHNGNLLGADYTVYFPLPLNPNSTGSVDKYGPVKVRRGMRFRGEAYNCTYEGEVEVVRISQLGACSVDIKVLTESDL